MPQVVVLEQVRAPVDKVFEFVGNVAMPMLMVI